MNSKMQSIKFKKPGFSFRKQPHYKNRFYYKLFHKKKPWFYSNYELYTFRNEFNMYSQTLKKKAEKLTNNKLPTKKNFKYIKKFFLFKKYVNQIEKIRSTILNIAQYLVFSLKLSKKHEELLFYKNFLQLISFFVIDDLFIISKKYNKIQNTPNIMFKTSVNQPPTF